MSETTLDFKINGNKNMDILPGVHGSFIAHPAPLFEGGFTHTVLSDYGEMLFHGIPTSFGSIWLSMYRMEHTAHLSAEANAASLEAMHLLEGDISFLPEGIQAPVRMKAAHWQMMHLPHVNNHVVLPAGIRLTTLDIHCNMEYLQKLSPFFSELDCFLSKVAGGKAATLSCMAIPIAQHVKKLIGGFFDTRVSTRDQQLFLERHGMDWLATGLENSFLSSINPVDLPLNETTRLREVFEYMMINIGEPLPISQLAKMAQMNEYKFKCAFKILFKLPVHQLLMEERLKRAMAMLQEAGLSLIDIATLSGYETYAGFSKEFKKKYGFPPSFFLKK